MSDEKKHTPGPWTAEHNTYNVLVRVPHATVALVMTRDNGDADLIAAAPDLLAALEECVRAQTEIGIRPGDRMEASIAAARTAIAKARGGNSAAPVVEADPNWCWACGSSHVPPEVCVPRSE